MCIESLLKGKDSLRDKLTKNDEDTETLRGDSLELQNQLNQIANEISPHDLQKCSKELDELLKDINARVPPPVVKIQFKKKPKSRSIRNRPKMAAGDTSNESKMVSSDQDFNVVEATTTYENLLRCTVTGTHTIEETGNLTFQNLESCTINIYEPVFHAGSIHLLNCNDCSIYLHTGKEAQVRLHALKNCKLMIRPSHAPQRIVMERCQDCVFHEVCEPWVTIQEFDNLGMLQEQPLSYTFKKTPDWW